VEYDDLKILSGQYHIPLPTIEKDYAVTILLSTISRFPKVSQMVFKGGTALKKIYFPETRFSEDLDFTCIKDIGQDLETLLKKEIKNGLDINFTEVKKEDTYEKNSKKYSVKYNDYGSRPTSVKIDLSLRENVVGKVTNMPVNHMYQLGSSFSVPAMSLEEIMAEKVRAITYTPRPRHLYDIWYMLEKKNVQVISALVNSKISFYKEVFNIEKFKESVNGLDKKWKQDLGHLLAVVPPIEDVRPTVIHAIEKAIAKS